MNGGQGKAEIVNLILKAGCLPIPGHRADKAEGMRSALIFMITHINPAHAWLPGAQVFVKPGDLQQALRGVGIGRSASYACITALKEFGVLSEVPNRGSRLRRFILDLRWIREGGLPDGQKGCFLAP